MKKINKKGFTLIELLAIIVILAIIAVITVPIILNIIDNARKGAEKNSIIGYGKAVELAYTQYQYERQLDGHMGTANSYISDDVISDGGSISINGVEAATVNLKVEFDGDHVVCTSGSISNDGKVTLNGCQVVNGSGSSYTYSEGKATENS